MAERFNLTAQLQLQAPNTQQVASQIKKDLGGLKINVQVQQDAKALAGINNQLQKTDKAAKSASKSMNFLNKGIGEAARRFSVITVATGSFIALARGIKNSTKAAVEFEREIVRISQVTGTSTKSLEGLQNRVTQLSTDLGVANATLLQTARVLTQAGLSARKTSQALEVLANTTLAPSFDNIIDTTEGAIAILNQFGRQAAKTGNDIKFLEQSLDAINAVSKNFAVESADLISAIRRTGGVFQAAGGNLKELVALFTSVRQTTRESAETIATGFRTIFTRLQRKDTIEALQQLGIALQDAEGKFVGPLKAIESLSTGLAGLDPKDVRFNEIVEQLGGFRQIGKVIPLLKQYAVAQNALAVANSSAGSTAKDAEIAQQSLAQQFAKVREQFDALIRKFTGSDTFQGLARTVIKLAESFLKFSEALERVLPQLTAIAAIKIGQNLAPGVASLLGGGTRKNAGGKILGFNSGGFVPGSGNRDTVPAMLTPGEFVIRKGSVQKLGAENLARMNEGRARYSGGTTGKGVKASDAKSPKGVIVKAGGGAQASHIGPAIELSDAELKKFFSDYGGLTGRGNAKFKRSFAQNVAGISTTKIVDGKEVNKSAAELYGAEYKAALEKTISNPASLNQARQAIGLKAQNPTLLNWPASFNQALRVTDPNLVAKDDLIAATSKEKNLLKIGNKATSAKFSANSKIRSDLVAGIRGISTRKENTRNGRAAFDVDSELNGLKSILVNSIESQDEQVAAQLLRDVDFIFKGGKSVTSKGKARTSQERFSKKNFVQKALGGLIQKFAAGGIVDQKAAGAAILDPVGSSSSSITVSGQDVKGSFNEFKGLPKGKDPISQFYKSTNFSVAKSGLNKETSDKFKNILEDGLVAGINNSAAALSRDLGTPSATISQGETGNFVRAINTSIFGRLYETVIESISNQGKFSGTDPNRPFDAEGGLPSGLKDNFSGLPAKFIDLKSSLNEASDKSFKSKITNQIKRELIQDGILNVDYPGKAGKDKARTDAAAKQAREAAARGEAGQGFGDTVKRRRGLNKGGGISGKDTVPALLTPGEFVFNKKAAQSIGYGNLNRMNTQGVQGYNKGGTVGFRRYANGTGPTGVAGGGGGAGFGSLDLGAINAAIAELEASAKQYDAAISSASSQIDSLRAAQQPTEAAIAAKIEAENALAATYTQLGEALDAQEFAQLAKEEENLAKTLAEQDKQLNALIEAEKKQEEASKKATEAESKGPGSRQPKKERVGPKPGDNIGAGAQKALDAVAVEGVSLAAVQKAYKTQLQAGVSKQDAINKISTEASAQLSQSNETNKQVAAANKELTSKYTEAGARTDQEINDRNLLNASLKQQADQGPQVTAIVENYKQKVGEGVGVQQALKEATNEVVAEQGVALNTSKNLRAAAAQRVKNEKKVSRELEAEAAQLAESDPSSGSAGAVDSGGSKNLGGKDCISLCKESLDAIKAGGAGGGGGGVDSAQNIATAGGGDTQQASKLSKTFSKISDGANKFASGTQKVSGALNGIASAAIAATFVIGTLTEQFSSASEAQKEQQQAGLAAVGAFLGIGAQVGSLTLQLVATIAATAGYIASQIAASGANVVSTVTEGAESGANVVSTATELTEAGANTASAGASAGLAVALIALTAIVAALVLAFATGFLTSIYASATAMKQLEQNIKKFNQVADKELDKLSDPTTAAGASESTFVDAQAGAAVADFQKELISAGQLANAFARGWGDTLEVAGYSAAGALVGGIIGGFLAPVSGGTSIAIGAAIGGLIGGAAAGTTAYVVQVANITAALEKARAAIAADIAARQKEQATIEKISRGFATTTFRATKAVSDFDRALRDAKLVGLGASDTLALLAQESNNLITEYEAGAKRLESTDVELDKLKPRLVEAGLITESGSDTTGQQSALDKIGEGDDGEERRKKLEQQLDRFKELDKQRNQAYEAQNKLLKKVNAQEAQIRQQQIKALGETIKGIEERARAGRGPAAEDIVLDANKIGGDFSKNLFNEIAKADAAYANAITKSQKQIEKTIKREFEIRIEAAKKDGDGVKVGLLLRNQQNRLAISTKRLALAQNEKFKADLIAKRNRLSEVKTQLLNSKALATSSKFLAGFNSALLGATKTAQTLAGIDNVISLATGGRIEAGTNQNAIDALSLENPTEINKDVFEGAVDAGVTALKRNIDPADTQGLAQADEIGAVAKLSRDLPQAIENTLLATRQRQAELKDEDGQVIQAEIPEIKLGDFGKRLVEETNINDSVDRIFDQLDSNLGGALAGSPIAETVRETIKQKLEDGEITFDEAQDIIDSTAEISGKYKEVLVKTLEIQDKYAQNLSKLNNAIIDARSKADEARGKVEDVRERVAERNASARGQQRSRNDREQGRRRAATERLGVTARGAGAIAGDVGATSAALARLEKAASDAEKKQRAATNSLDREKFADQANKFAEGAQKARDELERLADQSKRAADVEEDLANLRKQGSQIESLQEKLAFGSDEQRAQIGQDFKNLNLALAQGGLSGRFGTANEEQRASVARALDSVSDQVIKFEGQDLLGSEVKQIIAARETGRIGAGGVNDFLDKIRRAENPLLAELTDIGNQEIAASQALAQSADRQIKLLEDIKFELKNNFDADIQKETEKAQKEQDKASEVKNLDGTTSKRDDLIKNLDDQITKIDSALSVIQKNINTLSTELEVLETSFRRVNEIISGLESNEERRDNIEQRKKRVAGKKVAEDVNKQSKGSRNTLTIDQGTGFDLLSLQKTIRDEKTGEFKANPEVVKLIAAIESGEDSVTLNIEGKQQEVDLSQSDFALGERIGEGVLATASVDEVKASTAGAAAVQTQTVKSAAEAAGLDPSQGLLPQNFQQGINDNTAAIDKLTQAILGDAKSKAVDEDRGKTRNVNVENIDELAFTGTDALSLTGVTPRGKAKARGGLIYRAGGGSIFKPRGTDTVPAMLTPGEFVIRKSAVDAIGKDTLSAINSGNATVYKAGGGVVPSGNDVTSVFIKAAQDPKLLRRALAQGFEGQEIVDGELEKSDKKKVGSRTGSALFGAIVRLSKSNSIAPTDLGDSAFIAKAFEDYRTLSSGTIAGDSSTSPKIPLADVTKNIINSFGALQQNQKVTANQNRLAKEFLSSNPISSYQKRSSDLANLNKKVSEQAEVPAVKFANILLKSSGAFTEDPIKALRSLTSGTKNNFTSRVNELNILFQELSRLSEVGEGGIFEGSGALKASIERLGGIQKENAEQAKKAEAKDTNAKKENLSGRLKKDFELLQNAGILKMATGGSVGGEDSVPAMLTPGEFVMNPKAVKKYGVGYMRQLNRGNVPGFKRGGLVGGSVAYRANGSTNAESGGSTTFMIDPGPLQSILTEFNAAFGSNLDNVVEKFSSLTSSMDNLASAISQGMVVQHQFSGDMTLAFSISNGDALKNQIAEAITPKIQEIITTELDRRLSNNNFRAGS